MIRQVKIADKAPAETHSPRRTFMTNLYSYAHLINNTTSKPVREGLKARMQSF